MTRACELLLPVDKAAKVQAMVEDATGEPCPCKQGLCCPLMPESPASLLRQDAVAVPAWLYLTG